MRSLLLFPFFLEGGRGGCVVLAGTTRSANASIYSDFEDTNDFAYHETATYRSFEYSNQLNITGNNSFNMYNNHQTAPRFGQSSKGLNEQVSSRAGF